MRPILFLVELVSNAARLIRNLLVLVLPAPDYAVVTLTGNLPERRAALPLLQRLLRPPPMSLEDLRRTLDRAARSRMRGIVLRVHNLEAGMATRQSVREALARFRASGKRVAAYLYNSGLSDLYLASAADVVVVPPSAEVTTFGPRVELAFFREALGRWGVLPQFHHIAEYKTAAHRFLYRGATEPQREVTHAVLDATLNEITDALAERRRVTREDVQRLVDRGVPAPEDLRQAGLADHMAYEDDLAALLADGRSARIVPLSQARRSLPVRYRWRSLRPDAVGVVVLRGTIVPGESRELPLPLPLLGQVLAGCDTVARAFRAAERAPHVKAVVFHVDSRGGSAVASDLIWREVTRLRRRKPVVVHMGDVAGSGGYYVSCGASWIVAGATTITGSIGVVSGKFDVHGLLARAGIHHEILSRGASATMPSALAPYTDADWQTLRAWMERIYHRFRSVVAEGRGRTEDEVEAVARGRVWTGRQALAVGLVDQLGDFDTAVRRAKELAGIPERADVAVVTIHPPQAAPVPAHPTSAWGDWTRALRMLLAERAWLIAGVEPPV
ncbi:MAG: signal peptide peptidase SppA [Armatimonadota bacterium]|nr:signal peptide peptidase SppA [Armatimonadota bacterium]MDR5696539.1 signal peptide peptidase SppA [Armatimonadota bacterium]